MELMLAPAPMNSAVRGGLTGQAKYTPVAEFLAQLQSPAFLGTQRLINQWSRVLQGLTQSPTSFDDESFDETAFRIERSIVICPLSPIRVLMLRTSR